jgi:membrane protein implicated in regulation of membrane protease activity
MKKITDIPIYLPISGLLLSIILLLISAHYPSMFLNVVAIILLHVSGWVLLINFLLSGIGFFSSILGGD